MIKTKKKKSFSLWTHSLSMATLQSIRDTSKLFHPPTPYGMLLPRKWNREGSLYLNDFLTTLGGHHGNSIQLGTEWVQYQFQQAIIEHNQFGTVSIKDVSGEQAPKIVINPMQNGGQRLISDQWHTLANGDFIGFPCNIDEQLHIIDNVPKCVCGEQIAWFIFINIEGIESDNIIDSCFIQCNGKYYRQGKMLMEDAINQVRLKCLKMKDYAELDYDGTKIILSLKEYQRKLEYICELWFGTAYLWFGTVDIKQLLIRFCGMNDLWEVISWNIARKRPVSITEMELLFRGDSDQIARERRWGYCSEETLMRLQTMNAGTTEGAFGYFGVANQKVVGRLLSLNRLVYPCTLHISLHS